MPFVGGWDKYAPDIYKQENGLGRAKNKGEPKLSLTRSDRGDTLI